jgi:hypothetical protein
VGHDVLVEQRSNPRTSTFFKKIIHENSIIYFFCLIILLHL